MASQRPGAPSLEGTNYEFVKYLDSGTFGTVQLVKSKTTNQLYAAKFIPKGQVTKYVQREILSLRMLFHPHVVVLKEAFLTERHLGIAMEYAPYGNLFTVVQKRNGLTEDESRSYFQQLILGLDYCHMKGVVNRDIKLENLLIGELEKQKVLKICDFGFAKGELDSAPDTMAGTESYMAPEVLVYGGRQQAYDGKKADVWSCGVVLYVMLFARYPFERDDDQHLDIKGRRQILYKRICEANFQIPSTATISPECRDMLRAVLSADPNVRLATDQIMRHPWCAKGLGEAVFSFNRRPDLVPPPNAQSEADIMRVCEEAQKPLPPKKYTTSSLMSGFKF